MKTFNILAAVLALLTAQISTFVEAQESCHCVPPPSNIVGWWAGEDSAEDLTGNNEGTPVGNVTYLPSKVGKGFYLDGSSYIQVPNDPSLNFGTSEFSVEFWLYPTDLSGYHEIYHKRDGSGSHELELRFGEYTGDRLLYFQLNNGHSNRLVSRGKIPTDMFTHIAFVRSPTDIILYINGIKHIRTANTFEDVSSSSDLLIGAFVSNPPIATFKGIVDEVTAYNKALSEEEVQAIFDAGAAGKCRPL